MTCMAFVLICDTSKIIAKEMSCCRNSQLAPRKFGKARCLLVFQIIWLKLSLKLRTHLCCKGKAVLSAHSLKIKKQLLWKNGSDWCLSPAGFTYLSVICERQSSVGRCPHLWPAEPSALSADLWCCVHCHTVKPQEHYTCREQQHTWGHCLCFSERWMQSNRLGGFVPARLQECYSKSK